MGYNIGTRLIEDFLARTGLQRCSSFAETAEVVSKVSRSTQIEFLPYIPELRTVGATLYTAPLKTRSS
jgi:hypothetical protein